MSYSKHLTRIHQAPKTPHTLQKAHSSTERLINCHFLPSNKLNGQIKFTANIILTCRTHKLATIKENLSSNLGWSKNMFLNSLVLTLYSSKRVQLRKRVSHNFTKLSHLLITRWLIFLFLNFLKFFMKSMFFPWQDMKEDRDYILGIHHTPNPTTPI